MHFPVSIQIGDISILLHSIFETAGFFIGFRYFLYLRKRQGDVIEQSNRVWILIGATFGALIGSRLVGGFENVPAMLQSSNKLFYFYQNKTVVGGFLGGLFGVELCKKLIGEKYASGDLFTYPMMLALIIGRFGCFSMGVYEETYGLPTSLPWGMNLGDGIARHPVALYEAFFLIAIWRLLVAADKKYALANGARFKIFMIAYIFFRLALDFIKPHYTFSFGLSTIQIACLCGLIYYCRYITRPSLLLSTTTNTG